MLDLLAKLQTQVLKNKSILEQEFRFWERSFLSKNNLHAPGKSDFQSNVIVDT